MRDKKRILIQQSLRRRYLTINHSMTDLGLQATNPKSSDKIRYHSNNPRTARMFITLGNSHDRHYTCQCVQTLRGRLSKINMKSWTCNTCQKPVTVFMCAPGGNTYTVEHRFAKDMLVNDHVVFRCGVGLSSGDVSKSHPYCAKASNWYLYNGGQIGARDYVNVEVNTFVQVVTPGAGQPQP